MYLSCCRHLCDVRLRSLIFNHILTTKTLLLSMHAFDISMSDSIVPLYSRIMISSVYILPWYQVGKLVTMDYVKSFRLQNPLFFVRLSDAKNFERKYENFIRSESNQKTHKISTHTRTR